jgi:hypothetical protein
LAIGLRNKLASFAIIAILITSVYATTAAPTPAFANHTRTCDTPDFFGYRCIDSNQVGGPVFSYIDISATGIPILPEVDDAVAINIPVGFDFNFYGTDYTTLAISSNGLTFTGPATTQFSNQPIGASTPSNFVAPFWDDLVTFGPGIIYYQTQGTAPTRTFIAQWHNVQGFSSSPSAASFQVILKESSPDILFQYLDVDFGNFRTNGADATVGIESPSGVGSQYSFNEASLSNDLAIVFTRSIAITHPLNGASLNTPSFTATGVAFHPSGIQSVEVEVDGTGFNPATGTDSWSYDVGTLSEGPHTITARQTANDQSTETAVSMFDIDLTPPNPTIIDPIPGQIITGNPYTMIGTSEAGAQVDIFDGPNQLGSTLADGSGMWSFDVFLTNGPHTLRVSSIDRAGNPSPSFFDVFVTVDIQIPPLLGATQFSGDLYGINPDTGAFSFLSTANVQLSGIDYSPDGTLYGARTELFTIEPISGVATQVGVVGTTCSDITFAGNLYCITPRASQLHIIDTTLGTYQLVGPTNIIAGSGGAIAARSDGVLFAGADTGLYTLDPATGLATQVAPWTNPPELEGQSCRPNAFEFDPIDRLFVSYNCGGGEGGGNHYLVTADTSTGILTFIGQTVPGLDAIAMRNQIPPIVNLKILKFNDHNANQIQDLGDEPLAGWHVTVTDNNGDVICEGDTRADDPNTPQDEAGTLECNGIDTADNEAPFSIQETLQPGFANTTPNPRVVFPFSPTLQVKIGNVLVSEIHGLKWNDLNGDGIRDQNEPGVSGVEICLYEEYDGGGGETELASSSSDPVCVTTMNDDPNTPQDEAGMYWILGLLPGFYEIYENVPPGTVQTFPQFGQSWFVTLLDGQIMEGIDFGNVAPGELRGNKWSDTNANGVRDAGEPPVSGVQIDLYKLTPPDNTGFFFTNTFTDVNGDYAFIGIPPGFYRIVEQPFGASQTFPPNGQPYFTSLVAGQIRTGLDFGNTQVPPGSITGTKWNDQNGNGLRDAGEPGVPGVQICLTPSFQCTFTDVNGDYRFDNIPAGVHNVQENIPFGAVNTTPIFLTVAVISAQTTSGVDFGNTAPTPPPPEITIGGLSSWQFGNLPVIYWGNPTTYTKNVGPAFFDHCGADQPTSITLVITFPETNGQRSRQMTQQGTSELWSTTFGPFLNPGDGSSHTDHGVASLRFDVFCPNGPLEIQQGGSVYIDPSGTIVDACTNNPIEAATVTILVESPPGTGNYIIAPAATPPLIPDTNPQTTLADGAYGWDVTPGNYIVRAEKANYITNESVVLAIPPPVTLLTIPLSPDADNDGIPDACIVDNLPDAVDDSDSTDEDTPVTTNVLENDSGLGDAPVIVSIETAAANGLATVNPDNSVRYVPNADFNGADSYSYRVTDVDGDSDTAQVFITVNPVNDGPTAPTPQNFQTNEDTTLNGQLVAEDVDGNTLTFSLNPVIQQIGPLKGTVTVNGDGTFTYIPNPNENGNDQFSALVSDGMVDSFFDVFIEIIPVNDPPTADNQNFQTNEDTPLNGQLVAGDPDFDLLRFAPETQPTLGTLALNPDGSFTYSPNANENGQDTFQVRVSDGNQAVDSFFDVFFDIMPVNDSPTADPIPHLMVDEGQLVTFTVMGHDIDLPAQTLSYSLISGPLGASIDPLTGEFRWQTTEADGPGVYQIQIRVSDGAVDSFFDVFTEITVNELPDPVTYCDDRTLEQLLADASYNVIDNRDGHLGTKFKGTNGKDLILLSDAGNKVSARNGNDCMIGGAGNDDMQGNDGDDQIFGQGGKDKISGNKGNDKLNGGDDDDKLNGGKGNDMISGGAGKDKIQGHSGMDTITGDDGDDKIHGGKDADNISGGNGNDNIHGHQGADTLNGNDGDDKIQGGQGDDTIDGGAGTNKCNGGQGNNTITNCAPDNNMRDEDEEEEEAEDD